MPKLTSGLTQRERLDILQSNDKIRSVNSPHEQVILQLYRKMILHEYQDEGNSIKHQQADNAHSAGP
ncbi:MAG: hypothetical protein P8179_01620 [Candidatus Thiodiazotropha sp.]|jgi:hypothetical protein